MLILSNIGYSCVARSELVVGQEGGITVEAPNDESAGEVELKAGGQELLDPAGGGTMLFLFMV